MTISLITLYKMGSQRFNIPLGIIVNNTTLRGKYLRNIGRDLFRQLKTLLSG